MTPPSNPSLCGQTRSPESCDRRLRGAVVGEDVLDDPVGRTPGAAVAHAVPAVAVHERATAGGRGALEQRDGALGADGAARLDDVSQTDLQTRLDTHGVVEEALRQAVVELERVAAVEVTADGDVPIVRHDADATVRVFVVGLGDPDVLVVHVADANDLHARGEDAGVARDGGVSEAGAVDDCIAVGQVIEALHVELLDGDTEGEHLGAEPGQVRRRVDHGRVFHDETIGEQVGAFGSGGMTEVRHVAVPGVSDDVVVQHDGGTQLDAARLVSRKLGVLGARSNGEAGDAQVWGPGNEGAHRVGALGRVGVLVGSFLRNDGDLVSGESELVGGRETDDTAADDDDFLLVCHNWSFLSFAFCDSESKCRQAECLCLLGPCKYARGCNLTQANGCSLLRQVVHQCAYSNNSAS